MPLFTLHRNYVLRTTKGHSIAFEKGKPTHVPPICIEDAVAIGAIPVDAAVNVLGDEKPEVTPLTPDQRKAAIFAAFDTMSAREERIDFTASGVPNAKRIPALVGFEITPSERDTYWLEYRAKQQEAKDQAELDASMGAVA